MCCRPWVLHIINLGSLQSNPLSGRRAFQQNTSTWLGDGSVCQNLDFANHDNRRFNGNVISIIRPERSDAMATSVYFVSDSNKNAERAARYSSFKKEIKLILRELQLQVQAHASPYLFSFFFALCAFVTSRYPGLQCTAALWLTQTSDSNLKAGALEDGFLIVCEITNTVRTQLARKASFLQQSQ